MFAKLLKYDIKAVFKYWWLGAVACLVLSLMGGFCMKLVNVEYTKYYSLQYLCSILVGFARAGIYLFPVFTAILLVIRYYKHFFTDEGYLTFTLPVKKNSLLDSKIITGVLYSILSTGVSLLSLYIIILIGNPKVIGTSDFLYEYSSIIYYFVVMFLDYDFNTGVIVSMGAYSVPYIVLAVLLSVASVLVQLLFIYSCITFAASLVKKHKFITAIGIYYGTSSVVGVVLAVLFVIAMFSSYTTVYDSYYISETTNTYLMSIFVMTLLLGGVTTAIGLMYLLLTFLLDKKLNLE